MNQSLKITFFEWLVSSAQFHHFVLHNDGSKSLFFCFYSDRPDNMAVFEKIRIEADKESYPVLLSNGNFVESGEVEDSDSGNERHFAVWSDPFPKPSYLFCAVSTMQL